MIKVRVKPETKKTQNITLSKDIPHGTVFTGWIGPYNCVFLKLNNYPEKNGDGHIYPLNDLRCGFSWDGDKCPVNNYRPIDIVITEKYSGKQHENQSPQA